jgi:hypothetical protein
LELLLDNYFENERVSLNHEWFLQDQLKRALSGQPVVKSVTIHSEGYDTNMFDTPPEELPSWSEEALKPWLEVKVETFHEVVGFRQSVTLRDGPNVPSPAQQLIYGISTAMRHDSSLRLRAVHWELLGLKNSAERERLERLVREVWNGMRRLPYTDEDIAVACGTLLELCAQPGCCSWNGSEIRRAFQAWRPDAMEVEFGAKDDTGSRGFCSAEHLQKVISPQWLNNVMLSRVMTINTPRSALQICNIPSQMLEFSAFAELFGRELIPSQLAVGRSLVHFNPARMVVFGLP